MDPISATSTASAAQGLQGHHRHHKSMSQKLDDMSTAIDDALKAGKLSSDQATSMKKELDDIKQKIASAQGTAASGKTGQTNQLSQDDRKKIGEELHDIGKQLRSALNPQAAASQGNSNPLQDLFAQIDANKDGNIDKNEFHDFADKQAKDQQSGKTYGQGGAISFSASFTQTQINITA